jgi:fructose-bisphosphate aldolase, class I
MVVPGKSHPDGMNTDAVAKATVQALRRTVPAAVPTINFLSGGQTPQQATDNLRAMNALGDNPWALSFSYGRALQEPCLAAWAGKDENIEKAQAALLDVSKQNSAASLGK